MNEYDDKGEPHGYWELRYDDKNGDSMLVYKGYFYHGVEIGLWKWYSIDKKVFCKEYYL